MGILDVEIVKLYIRMCQDGWEQGCTSATAAT